MTNRIAQALNFTGSTIPASPALIDEDMFDETMESDPPTPDGVYLLAHSKPVQRLFDQLQIGWGAQYEIARGVSLGLWDWGQVLKADLRNLRGSNRGAAPRVREVILGRAPNTSMPSDQALWYVFLELPHPLHCLVHGLTSSQGGARS